MSRIDNTGLHIDTYTDTKNKIEKGLKSIYGENINLDQNSPDEQLAVILTQIITNLNEVLQDLISSFDPDQAVGVVLDQRVKINGITRKSGSYTRVYVSIEFNDYSTVKGLDQYSVDDCFKVADDTGNILVCEQTISGIEGEILTVSFRALNYGTLIFNSKSITVINTPQVGVKKVSNDNAQYVIGSDEESDTSLRIRRTVASLPRAKIGEIEAIISAINNIEGVSYADVKDNTDDIPDVFNIPAHGIWIIVEHIEDMEVVKNIGEAIYNTIIPGTPMKKELEDSSSSSGEITDNQGFYIVTRPDGSTFTVYWTKPSPQYIDITIECKMLDGSPINEIQIIETVRNNLAMKIGEHITTNIIENILFNNIEGIVVNKVTIAKTGEAPVEDYILSEPDKRFVAESIIVTQER